MFCSVIIPTIGRETLARTVHSVLTQQLSTDQVEVIVVNDGAEPLPPAPWQESSAVRIIHTNRRERSIARNSGAALARGHYLYFLDDDDWLLPGALEAFSHLSAKAPDAAWLSGGIRIISAPEECLGEANAGLQGNCFAQILGGAWVPIQSSLIRADTFFAVGGYDPFICGTEDQDLCRKIAAQADFASTEVVVACLFRGEGWQTSTLYARAPEDTRISRDAVVSLPNVFGRLIRSAGCGYWYGRIFRIYAGLAWWQLRRRNLLTALSRFFYALATLFVAGHRALSPAFWQAFRAAHVPGTLHFFERQFQAASSNDGQESGRQPGH